jgi:hypothetical protein
MEDVHLYRSVCLSARGLYEPTSGTESGSDITPERYSCCG